MTFSNDKILWDYQSEYAPSCQSSCASMSMSSFGSNISYDMADIRTPPSSTRQSSLASLKPEGMTFSPANTPDLYGNSSVTASLLSMHDMGPRLTSQTIVFPDGQLTRDQALYTFGHLPKYDSEEFQCFQSNHGLPIHTPALEMDLVSPISGMEPSLSMDFVDPSQTTFSNVFDISSPMSLMKPIQFQSPDSDYSPNHSFELSPMANLSFQLQYEDCKSASTTPSRASTSCRASSMRQPIFEPIRSSGALQRAQEESQAVRRARKRLQRGIDSGTIPSIVRIQHAADKPCLHPGCDRKFKRQEHLKRHEKIHTDDPERFACPCCSHEFKGRSDNLKTHLRLHMEQDNPKRVKYHEDARAYFEEMDRKKKKRTKTEDTVKLEDGLKIPIRNKSRLTIH